METRVRSHKRLVLGLVCGLAILTFAGRQSILPTATHAQPPSFGELGGLGEGLSPFGPLGGFGSEQATHEATFTITEGTLEGVISVEMTVIPGWHTFSLTQGDGALPSELSLGKSADYELAGEFTSQPGPDLHAEFGNILEMHRGTVVFSAPLRISEGVDPEQLEIQVEYNGQVCTDTIEGSDVGQCVPLSATLTATFASYEKADVAAAKLEGGKRTLVHQPLSAKTLAVFVAFGLMGGLILNLMPCVLPVVGLKILSFAEQAGHARGRVLALNLWFSAGLIAVFMVLATLAAALQMSWGEQFTHGWFKLSLICVVFAMALSFLGVWEIPLPGFVGIGKANDLQAKEGPAGAFFKGVFTTILATPCSGPFLGPVFAYTATQPPLVTYLIFGSVGVGMASPYIAVGLQPKLVKMLPKPGAWMETFKQFMAFVLLATVVFLFTTIKNVEFLPTLATLFGIWFACWMIGRIEFTATRNQKLRGWAMALCAAVLIGGGSFRLLGEHEAVLPWTDYSSDSLASAQEEGKTVMVDFTAQWCLTCKMNYYWTIDTDDVLDVVEELDVVPMLADWTDRSEEIKSKLLELNSNSIPLLAIYPANRPDEPIILRDVISKKTLIDALREAGPSTGTAAKVTSEEQRRTASSSRSSAAGRGL
ncbi:MAG: thioredoxin family protein [Pirellulaceae bacterium]